MTRNATKVEASATVPGLSPEAEAIIAALKEEQARLLAEMEELRKRPARAVRIRKPSPKQQKLLDFLAAHPDKSVPEAVAELGLGGEHAADSFVWRMVLQGWLTVSLPKVEEEASPEDAADSTDTQAEAA